MRISKTAIVSGAILALTAGAIASTTSAQAGSSLCPAKRACIYLDANYNGLYGQKSAGSGLSNIAWENNDKMSSWENKTTRDGAWYYDEGGHGPCKDMRAGSQRSYKWLDGVNDKLSSWRMNDVCPD